MFPGAPMRIGCLQTQRGRRDFQIAVHRNTHAVRDIL
jgi:hypothetical protein